MSDGRQVILRNTSKRLSSCHLTTIGQKKCLQDPYNYRRTRQGGRIKVNTAILGTSDDVSSEKRTKIIDDGNIYSYSRQINQNYMTQ